MLFAATLVLMLPRSVFSRTWYVKVDGSGDAPTIQAAIDSAGMDDTVLVAPGVYSWTNQGGGNNYGMLRMMRGAPALTIRGEMGAEATILDGETYGRIFFYQGYYPGTPGGLTIDGFTFFQGYPTQVGNLVGGAFTAHLSSPVLRNCVFRENTAEQGGAVWYGGVGSPLIENCFFESNGATYGGAIFAINTPEAVTISGCTIRNNVATRGGAIYGYNAPLVVQRCVIVHCYGNSDGGGVYLNKCYPSSISETTLFENVAPSGSAFSLFGASILAVNHSIVAGGKDGAVVAVPSTASLTFSCSDLFSNDGGDWIGPIADQFGVNGNFSADPLFCNPSALELGLQADSPCTPGNHPDGAGCGLVGRLGAECGRVPAKGRSWGAIKSMFVE
jgi:hypothetical protein